MRYWTRTYVRTIFFWTRWLISYIRKNLLHSYVRSHKKQRRYFLTTVRYLTTVQYSTSTGTVYWDTDEVKLIILWSRKLDKNIGIKPIPNEYIAWFFILLCTPTSLNVRYHNNTFHNIHNIVHNHIWNLNNNSNMPKILYIFDFFL